MLVGATQTSTGMLFHASWRVGSDHELDERISPKLVEGIDQVVRLLFAAFVTLFL
jgi:hypothetical protein